jgi:hypothetical protein
MRETAPGTVRFGTPKAGERTQKTGLSALAVMGDSGLEEVCAGMRSIATPLR